MAHRGSPKRMNVSFGGFRRSPCSAFLLLAFLAGVPRNERSRVLGVRAVEGSVRQPLVCSREALQNLIILLYVYLRKVILQRPLHQKGLSPKVTGVVYVQTSNQHPDKSKFENSHSKFLHFYFIIF